MNFYRGVLWILGTLALPVWATPTDEAHCTEAIATAQQKLPQIKTRTPQEAERLRQWVELQNKLIAESRRRGASECKIWGLMMESVGAKTTP